MWIAMNKLFTALFWLLALASYVLGWEGLLGYLPMAAVVIAAAHVLEVAFFWVALKDKSDAPGKDAVLIMIFGIFHMQQFMNKPQQG